MREGLRTTRMAWLDLNKLRLFAAVAERESFSRAAEELNISQPSLSVHIRDLERHYGVPLFERRGRGVAVTVAGRLVHSYARRILALAGESEEAVDDLQGVRLGELRLGASTTIGEYLLPDILGDFQRVYPGVRISVAIANTLNVLDLLRHGELHLGLIGESVEDPELELDPFLEDRLVLTVPPAHRLAGAEVPAEEISRERWISREPGSATRDVTEQALGALGVSAEVSLELGGTEAVKRAVAAGLGVAFISACAARHEVETGRLATARVIGLDVRRQFHIARRKGRRLTAAEQAFVVMLHGNPVGVLTAHPLDTEGLPPRPAGSAAQRARRDPPGSPRQ